LDFILDKMETKIEFFEAHSLKALEEQIDQHIQINKALLLDVHAVQHQSVFDPRKEKMLYTAVVHFKTK